MESTLHGWSIIAGTPRREPLERPFRAVSPLNSEPLEPAFYKCGTESAAFALQEADAAFAVYGKTSPAVRAAFLDRVADEIAALGDALLERAHQESGLPLDRLTGERARTVNQLRLFATLLREGSWCDARIDRALPDRKPLPRPDIRRVMAPVGPVIVFGASNFPLAFSVAGGDTASALAAGCPVIVKAHEAHPGTSELVASAIVRAVENTGLPPGVFSLVHGAGEEIGIFLVRHSLARAVGFTGSHVAGRALFDAAASRKDPIPVFAEMSSVNPVFILPDALRTLGAKIIESLRGSVTTGVGQFCTKPGLIFGVGGTELDVFAAGLTKAIQGTPPGTMLHAGIARSYHRGLDSMEKTPGVVSLAMSDTEADERKTQGEAVLFATDIDNFLQKKELQQEVFGPYALLISAPSIEKLTEAALGLDGQLTATLHATEDDLANAADLISVLERKAGRLIINGFPTGVEVCAAMHHGGPYPATTDERFTSVGTAAIQRWVRPICYQNFPDNLLPQELQNANPLGIMRLIDGQLTRESIK